MRLGPGQEPTTPTVYRDHRLSRPQNPFFRGGISPGVDSELVEETLGVFNPLIYDDGTQSGFVLVQETSS